MNDALSFLAELDKSDGTWLLQSGAERELAQGDLLLGEGQFPEELYIVLEGMFEAWRDGSGAPLARIGPCELLGELSFLAGGGASASVLAAEPSKVLALPHARIRERCANDPRFSARFHRALGVVVTRRLRAREAAFSSRTGLRTGAEDARPGHAPRGTDPWETLAPALTAFKAEMQRADAAAREAGGEVPEELVASTSSGLDDLCRLLTATFGEESSLGEALQGELAARVDQEFHPYVLLTRLVERIRNKPRGYAGDYLTIEWIYRDEPGGSGALGPLLDRLFLDRPAAQAVRNRRGLLAEEIRASREAAEGAARITSLACGPAEELFDVFAELQDKALLNATLIDVDFEALAHVSKRRDQAGLGKHMQLFPGNLVYLATGRQELDLAPQHLIYSIGLIDYFKDPFVVSLLDWIHDHLAPGGRVILGNFRRANPDKALMDTVLDWRLIHRDEDDMNRIFEQSKFGGPCSAVRYEPANVNLFAMGTKG